MTSFEQLSLPEKAGVILLQSDTPLSVSTLQERGVPLLSDSPLPGWIRAREDGRLEAVRRGAEYAAFCRHLRHTLGYTVDMPPVNTELPTEWYSPSSDASPPQADTPIALAEFEEASRLANHRLPPSFIRTLALVWLETVGGRGHVRRLVEALGTSFVHKDVEAVYLSLHTTRAARTDRDTGEVTVCADHPDLQHARKRFRDWLGQLRQESIETQAEQARLRACERQSQAVRLEKAEAFLAQRHGLVLVRGDAGVACGGILDPRTRRVDVYLPADNERFRDAIRSLQVVIGVDMRDWFNKMRLPGEDRILIDLRVPVDYVTVGRNRRRLHLADALTYTVGSPPEALTEVYHKQPQMFADRITAQLHTLERWYVYGRGHGYVMTGSHASQTVAVDWNPGGLPTLVELIDEAIESEGVVEVSLRARPQVFRPAAVSAGHVWWLDTGWVDVLDATRLFAMRRPQPVSDDGTEPFSMVVQRLAPEAVQGVRLGDQRRVELHPIQCRDGIIEGEVVDVTPVALEEHGKVLVVEGRLLGRGWSVGHLPAGPVGDPEAALASALQHVEAGRLASAAAIFHQVLQSNPRCLEAHAHLGSLWFNHGGPHGASMARKRYELGCRIGLPLDFKGVRPWAEPANRPLLRCQYGLGLSLWRLEQYSAAVDAFTRLLSLNPKDEQGVHMVMPLLNARIPWSPEGDEWV